jgi:hypothetical protein
MPAAVFIKTYAAWIVNRPSLASILRFSPRSRTARRAPRRVTRARAGGQRQDQTGLHRGLKTTRP